MSRMVGTISRGVRAPIIRSGDDLAVIVTDSVLEAAKSDGFEFHDKDIVAIVDISNMTFGQVQALHSGVHVKLVFGGNNCHVFDAETGINLEA